MGPGLGEDAAKESVVASVNVTSLGSPLLLGSRGRAEQTHTQTRCILSNARPPRPIPLPQPKDIDTVNSLSNSSGDSDPTRAPRRHCSQASPPPPGLESQASWMSPTTFPPKFRPWSPLASWLPFYFARYTASTCSTAYPSATGQNHPSGTSSLSLCT